MAGKLERSGAGSFAARIAHHWCELALEADARQQNDDAEAALRHAREAAPQAPRPLILAGQRARTRGAHEAALQSWATLLVAHPGAFNLVARDYADCAIQLGKAAEALERLEALYRRSPTSDLLAALSRLDDDTPRRERRQLAHLQQQPDRRAHV